MARGETDSFDRTLRRDITFQVYLPRITSLWQARKPRASLRKQEGLRTPTSVLNMVVMTSANTDMYVAALSLQRKVRVSFCYSMRLVKGCSRLTPLSTLYLTTPDEME
jgi:hypothetical protein